jgi:hypothetical protein
MMNRRNTAHIAREEVDGVFQSDMAWESGW